MNQEEKKHTKAQTMQSRRLGLPLSSSPHVLPLCPLSHCCVLMMCRRVVCCCCVLCVVFVVVAVVEES